LFFYLAEANLNGCRFLICRVLSDIRTCTKNTIPKNILHFSDAVSAIFPMYRRGHICFDGVEFIGDSEMAEKLLDRMRRIIRVKH